MGLETGPIDPIPPAFSLFAGQGRQAEDRVWKSLTACGEGMRPYRGYFSVMFEIPRLPKGRKKYTIE
jgi:hypothetical protein